jgi:type VI secretion system protein ImpL
MRALFKLRFLLILIGFALLAFFIWWAWEFFAFSVGDYGPDSVVARLVVIALVIGLWVLSLLYKRLKASRASDKLMAAVVKQADSRKERPSADALQLRERFEEAVASLKGKRRGGHTLYDLPWYIIIGAPGSGKTTALVNSGLHFPIEQRSGRGALRGVGGTRNCDWWFTDEAVFLDTAGRYTTQDSDASSDSAGWTEFL